VHIDRFFELVETTKSWMRDDKKPVFPRGSGRGDKKTIFVEIKVLMALRWLARGETFDTIGDLSETSETAARVNCELWVKEFALREWGAWVKVPEGEDLRREMEVFARMGLVGCGFSMDAVHVWYDACPAEFRERRRGAQRREEALRLALVPRRRRRRDRERVRRAARYAPREARRTAPPPRAGARAPAPPRCRRTWNLRRRSSCRA
jgi:hypothetical protein